MRLTDSIKQHISIIEYAERIGLTPVKQSENRYTLKEHDSVVIRPDQNVFTWNSEQKSGTVIDFAMAFKNLSLDEAYSELKKLLNDYTFEVTKANKYHAAPKATKPADVTFPTAFDGQYKRLCGYLCSGRSISRQVVYDMIKRDFLYEDDKHNCVFKGFDYDGVAKYGFKRSTITDSPYKREMPGTNEFNKQVGLYINNNAKSLFVSEAAIDNLSLMTLLHVNGRDYNQYNYLALGGTYVDCFKYHMMQPQNADIKLIYLATDNDDAGMKCRNEIKKWLNEIGYTGIVKDKIPVSKDWNEDLKKMSSNTQQQNPVNNVQIHNKERGIIR
ncbi:DUF3991 and TOPRIM domain-containing protein [Paludicola sp. MB14-C6]|uniref:DUF3991 and TOPRIM domain-containing protein n=1 Tax=Paludihabitans sp. MB14-C6 TaxID=3070656 RepID=UPI0027DC94C1|nr:DUF3991 and TOPRIM domain-containing protein [Paludicola sp. MB14-C6]WMJ22693.1 DUF3991 and TOPRIM domain-containing protein [Paludicola sp. MB14-C6]